MAWSPDVAEVPDRVLVTGACGFLGSHLIRSWAAHGAAVAGLDNFSRPSARLREETVRGHCATFHAGEVEDVPDRWVREFRPSVVVHLAAQVGLAESWKDPELDFRVNAGGTWHLLCALKELPNPPVFVFISTNKVYGEPRRDPLGVDERAPVRVDSPYALSKRAGELATEAAHRAAWVRGRILRCSCIYGPDQMGTESQGWVSHFANAAALGEPVSIHGTGNQVRDTLHVQDWMAVVGAAATRSEELQDAQVWNVGGGPGNTLTPNELWARLSGLLGRGLAAPTYTPRRSGDQDWFVSDIRAAARDLGWSPRIDLDAGLRTLLP